MVAVLVACTGPSGDTDLDQVVAKEAATQSPDLVDVTLYFRHGRGPDAFLTPVTREVPVGGQLARTAVSLLLQGPAPGDPEDLTPVVPTTTTVRDFAIQGTTATVDLTDHVVRDAAQVGKRPEHELLALAAIANTLTEFPEISRVAVTIDGIAGGSFWGGWGLPTVLLRDESVVEPSRPAPFVPDLASFTRRTQRTGVPRPSAVVTKVRIRPRATYLRVTLELSDADGEHLAGAVPTASARRDGDDIRLSVDARPARGLSGEQKLDDPAFRSARVDVSGTSLDVTVQPTRRARFALRTLTDPVRLVLDIRR